MRSFSSEAHAASGLARLICVSALDCGHVPTSRPIYSWIYSCRWLECNMAPRPTPQARLTPARRRGRRTRTCQRPASGAAPAGIGRQCDGSSAEDSWARSAGLWQQQAAAAGSEPAPAGRARSAGCGWPCCCEGCLATEAQGQGAVQKRWVHSPHARRGGSPASRPGGASKDR